MAQLLAALSNGQFTRYNPDDSHLSLPEGAVLIAGPDQPWDLPVPKTIEELHSSVFLIRPNGSVYRLKPDSPRRYIRIRTVCKTIGSIAESDPVTLDRLPFYHKQSGDHEGRVYYPHIVWANDYRNKSIGNPRADKIACKYVTCGGRCDGECGCYEEYFPHGCIITYFME